jgi:hypothetical protein
MPHTTPRHKASSTDLAILAHLQRNGRQTSKQVTASVAAERALSHSTVHNALLLMGRLVGVDTTTREPVYAITPAGQYTLQHGHRPPRAGGAVDGGKAGSGTAASHATTATPARAAHTPTRTHYDTRLDHKGDTTTIRPGSLHAFSLPSRWGDVLRWPGGAITLLDGGPLAEAA